ncbi:MAG: MarR family winged helix-turn-helix transcriptional regulator [Polymorphobacter sp.]
MSTKLVLDAFVPYRLSAVSNLVSDIIAQSYDRLFNISIAQWRVIAVVGEAGRLTPQAIGARTRMDKMTVSRAVKPLIERRLLVRADNADDGRSHLLSLTDTGARLYADVVPAARALEAQMLAEFAPAEVAALMQALDRLDAAAARLATPRDG